MADQTSYQCPNEIELAAYLAGSISSERRSRMEEHFSNCESCSQAIAELVKSKIDGTEKDDVVDLNRVKDRMDAYMEMEKDTHLGGRLSIARIIELHPRPRIVTPRQDGYVLAAATENEEPELGTYISDDGSILLRSSRNTNTGELELFLIVDDLAPYENAKVIIENQTESYRAECAPDQYGRISAGKSPALAPEKTSIVIQIPEKASSKSE